MDSPSKTREGVSGRSDAAPGDSRRIPLFFVLKLCLGWAACLLLVHLLPGIEESSCRLTAEHLSLLLRGAGIACTLHDRVLYVGTVSIEIIKGCTSVVPTILLGGAILAYPSSVARKAAGLACAVAALWLFNLARVLVLIAVLAAAPDAFDMAHVYVWRVLTSVVVVALFVLWIRRVHPAPRVAS